MSELEKQFLLETLKGVLAEGEDLTPALLQDVEQCVLLLGGTFEEGDSDEE